jgi:hypothetical protein
MFYDQLHLIEELIWAAGYGFSSSIITVVNSSTKSNGMIEVEAEGIYGPTTQGTWRLEIDSNLSYLVRHASYTVSGREMPFAVFENSGGKKWGDIFWPELGSISFFKSGGHVRDYTIDVRYIEYNCEPNSELFEDLRYKLQGEYPVGTSVRTYLGDFATSRALIKTVGPSDVLNPRSESEE